MGRAYVKISPEVLLHTFTEGNTICAKVTKGIPAGAKLTKAGYSDFDYLGASVFFLTFEHESIVEQEGVVTEAMPIEITDI